MNIKNELLHIATHIPEIHSVKYQSNSEAAINNTIAAKNTTDFPFLQIVALESGSFNHKPPLGLYPETWNIMLYLCTSSEFDFTTEQNQDLIEHDLKPLLRQIFGEINKSKKFEIVTKVDYKIQHLQFNYFETGIYAVFSLTEKQGSAIC